MANWSVSISSILILYIDIDREFQIIAMTDFVQYFFLTNILILFLLGIRGAYLDFKLMRYLRNNYPEKAREFGCPKGGWYNGFKFGNALYKEHDILDPYFLSLKTKAKNTQTLTILLLLLPFSLFLILILVGSLL